MKSDLQYYNKDNIDISNQYYRNIIAYAIYAHGSGDPNWLGGCYTCWVTDEFLGVPTNWLTPTEVSNLWYTQSTPPYSYISVYPTNTFIHATVCFGYSNSWDSYPYMARAFTDYGAKIFVGATVEIPAEHNDDFTAVFWESLVIDDETVYQATLDYISSHNSYYDDDWTYDTEIKLCGYGTAYFPN
jgi:hypothetical protein